MTAGAVIVGASHAGVQLAASLRQAGWQEPIRLFSAEDSIPYHRPPLSKAFLAGEKAEEQILLRSPDFFASQEIELRLNEPVLAIDPRSRTVRTDAGAYGYTKLVLATGSVARGLAITGSGLAGIHTLRDISDARRLREALAGASSVAVIGGGFIGLEFASTAVKSGKPTTVIEAQDRLMARVLPATVGNFLGEQHRGRGVRLLHGRGVQALEGESGRVKGVRLDDGSFVEAELVLLGVGGAARLDLARGIGLRIEAGGVLVDAHGWTGADDIHAIGDVASFRNRYADAPMRLESVQNASDQARSAAAHICGRSEPLTAVPWFWTDQYDLKVQMAGLGHPQAVEILRGDPRTGRFTLLQLRDDRLVGAHSVNQAADHMAARRLIGSGAALDPAAAADPDVPLLKAARSAELNSASGPVRQPEHDGRAAGRPARPFQP